MTECAICGEDKMTVFTECKHPICHNCLAKSGKLLCPLCRGPIEKVSEDLRDITAFIQMQRKKISELEEEIEILRPYAIKSPLMENDLTLPHLFMWLFSNNGTTRRMDNNS